MGVIVSHARFIYYSRAVCAQARTYLINRCGTNHLSNLAKLVASTVHDFGGTVHCPLAAQSYLKIYTM